MGPAVFWQDLQNWERHGGAEKSWLCTHGVYPPQSALSSKISSRETEKARKNERIKVKNITNQGNLILCESWIISFNLISISFCYNVILSFGEHPTNPKSSFSSLNFHTQYPGAQLTSHKRTDHILHMADWQAFCKIKANINTLWSHKNLLTK